MALLQQQQIEALLLADPPLIENFPPAKLETQSSPVRGATLDLTVGRVFLPGAVDGTLGSSTRGKRAHDLASGATAVVRTAETLHLPGNIAAIGFPPSTDVSLAGLLTTNPGHVDPGYRGQLHLTVINMGKNTFPLYEGRRIMRLMLFQLAPGPSLGPVPSPISEELLARLSPDFLNLTDRVAGAVDRAGWRLQIRNAMIPLVTAIIGGVLALGGNYFVTVQQMKLDIASLRARVDAIGSKVDLGTIEKRLDLLEKRTRNTMHAP